MSKVMNSLEKFQVYQKSIRFLALANRILQQFPRGYGELSDQLKRSSLSISLNCAEGAGKLSIKDKRRFFAMARGSALESYAVLDAGKVLELVEDREADAAKALLQEIIAMLTVLCGLKERDHDNEMSSRSRSSS